MEESWQGCVKTELMGHEMGMGQGCSVGGSAWDFYGGSWVRSLLNLVRGKWGGAQPTPCLPNEGVLVDL